MLFFNIVVSVFSSETKELNERSLPFLRHLKNFWSVIESVSMKKKQNHNPGSNLDLSYPNLSPFPLHYHTDRPRFRKK